MHWKSKELQAWQISCSSNCANPGIERAKVAFAARGCGRVGCGLFFQTHESNSPMPEPSQFNAFFLGGGF
jgi:hypothetical protein